MATRPPLTFQLNPAALGYTLARDFIPFPTLISLALLSYLTLARFYPRLCTPVLLLLLLGPFTEPALALLGGKETGNMKGVSTGKVVALPPAGTDGAEGEEGMAVVIIGARANDVWGVMGGRSRIITKQFIGMLDSLAKDPNSGLLNAEAFLSTTSFTRNRLQWILYFKSPTHVSRFAHEKLHKGVWKEYYAAGSDSNAAHEVWHEFFEVKGVPDTTYVNSKTHGMAGGYEPIFGDQGEVVRWESCRKVRGEQK